MATGAGAAPPTALQPPPTKTRSRQASADVFGSGGPGDAPANTAAVPPVASVAVNNSNDPFADFLAGMGGPGVCN